MAFVKAVSGEWQNPLLAISFWGLSQVLFMLTIYLYEKMLSYNLHAELEKDNVAVGIAFAGLIIAVGIIFRFALIQEFDTFSIGAIKILIAMIKGTISLIFVRYLVDYLLFAKTLNYELVGQEKPNVGAGLIEAFSYIGAALTITWII